MALQLATVVELDAWLGPRSPADPLPLLRTASRIVAHAVRVAVPLANDGTVSDTTQRQAVSDAVCAQVEAMLDHGVVDGTATSGEVGQSVDGVILNTEPAAEPATGGTTPATEIAPEALDILRTAGFVGPVVAVR